MSFSDNLDEKLLKYKFKFYGENKEREYVEKVRGESREMDLRQLKYFITIAESKTISDAAKKLNIAQPPLSTQLKMLEEELNVKLIERHPRFISLTDAGQVLYQRALAIIALTSATVKEVGDFRNGMQGTIKLGIVSSSGVALLQSRLKQFEQAYPKITFEIYEGNTFQLLDMLKNDVIDLALVRTPFETDFCECYYLQPEPMVAVSIPDLMRELPQSKIPITALRGKPIIYYRRMEHIINAAFEQAGVVPTIYCKNDDARTSLMWAQAGLGVAIVPKSIASIFSEQMKIKEIDAPHLVTKLALIHKKNSYCSNIMKNFMQLFIDKIE